MARAAAGAAVMSRGSITGITVGGLGVVADGDIRWVSLTAGTLTGTGESTGLMVGGYRVRAPRLTGVALSVIQTSAIQMRGMAVGGYNSFRAQRGLAIGIYNDARRLDGVQLGLINRARNNPSGFRWLPIVNAHF